MRRLGFIDVTLRDGHQCLWATRMTSAMMTPILATIDRAGYDYVNMLGGAVFDVCVRYLHENPWRRVETAQRAARHADGRVPARPEPVHVRALSRRHRRAQLAGARAQRPQERHRLRCAQRQPQRRGADRIGESRRHDGDRRHGVHGEPRAHRRLLRGADPRAPGARRRPRRRQGSDRACSRRSARRRCSPS